MKIVISLGGSVFLKDFSSERIRNYAEVLERASRENKLFVVVGGGKIARDYIRIARDIGADNTFCDYIGINVTRINAMLLCSAIKTAPKRIPKDFVEASELSQNYNIVVMGGTFPGHTTDATSALLAEFVNADLFLNATSVNGVYSEDPKRNPNAKRFEEIKIDDLIGIIMREETKAGGSFVLDLLAAKIVQRSKIKTIIFLGEPENIERVIRGDFREIGTLVIP